MSSQPVTFYDGEGRPIVRTTAQGAEQVEVPEGAVYIEVGDSVRAPADRSRYPAHVPTLREQAERAAWDLEDMRTMKDLRQATAVGVVCSPVVFRRHLESYYESNDVAERMDNHTVEEDGGRRRTIASVRGPDHGETAWPSSARTR